MLNLFKNGEIGVNRIVSVFLILLFERYLVYSINLNLWGWIALQTLLFSIAPIIVISLGKVRREEVGLTLGELGLGLRYVGVMLFLSIPIMVYGAGLQGFKEYYPIWKPAGEGITFFILFELAVLIMMFNTEFLFRGLLLFSLEKGVKNIDEGKWIAIVIHALVYMLVHVGKPGLEVPYSFFVGIVFGWLALKTRSIFPSLIAHWTSSVIFDILVIMM